jgi:hypothetical protein
VDNLVNKYLDSPKDAANGLRIHRFAYFLGIRPISTDPQVIVDLGEVPCALAYS